MFRPDYPVQTDRLLLRPFTDGDFAAMYAIQSNAEVATYLYWEPRSRNATRGVLNQKIWQVSLEREGDMLGLAVERRDTGQMIGQANLRLASEEYRQGELGYLLHPDHHKRGFGTEVATALLRLGFEGAGLHRVYGQCDARNVGSARVMERAGMRLEGHLRENEFVKNTWTDTLIYAMLAADWAP